MILTICAVGLERDYVARFRGDYRDEFGALMFLAYTKRRDVNGYNINLNRIEYEGDMIISTTF